MDLAPEADERFARLDREPMTVIEPRRGLFNGAGRSLAKLWRQRGLVGLLVLRDIRSKYREAVLGVVWSLIRPLLMWLVYYLVIGQVLGARRAIPDFAVYVFCGLVLWTLFSDALTQGTESIKGNASIVAKTSVSREVFPLAAVGSALFNFLFQAAVLVLAIVVTGGGVNPGLSWLGLPLGFLVVVVWVTALSLLSAAFSVYLRDVVFLIQVMLMVGFWASPIIYSWPQVTGLLPGWLAAVYSWNPVTVAILGWQKAVWSGGAGEAVPDTWLFHLVVVLAVGLVALFLAQRVFDRLQGKFAQEL
jgi:ABC-2 type transport system permease protein